MVVRQEASHSTGSAPPREFSEAVAAMRTAPLRSEVFCEEMPAPQRIAPFSFALSADVTIESTEVGTGRLILLHDPLGNDAWDGTFRCVGYARAELEAEMINDPLLGEVGWRWLLEALESTGAEFSMASGTVTRVTTEAFGGMAEDGSSGQIEIRASWTPSLTDPSTAEAHVRAWGQMLCEASGLEPVPEGVAAMPSRRGQRGGRDRH